MNIVVNWLNRHISDPQIVILAVLLIVGFAVVAFFGNLFAPIFAAVIIAYLLEGPVRKLERMKIPRLGAVILVVGLFLAFLVGILLILLPNLFTQTGELIQQLPTMIASWQQQLMLLPERYPEFVSQDQIVRMMTALKLEVTTMGQRFVTYSLASIGTLVTLIIYLVLVPLMVFFFLKDKEGILSWVKKHLPDNRTLAEQVWHDVDLQIGNYVRGKFWEILIVWVTSYITFVLLDLQYAMLVSVFVGLSVLLPYIGATVMYLPIGLIAFFQWGIGTEFLVIMIAYSIIQLLDGNVLAPVLLSEVTNLHPIAVIAAVLFFGGIWGFWGLFFAIPLATLVHAVIKAIPRRRLEAEAGG